MTHRLLALPSMALTALTALMLMAGAAAAQGYATAPTGVESLPLRNLQIEVRQVRGSSQSGSQLQAQGGVTLSPGQSGANVQINAQDSQRDSNRDLVQRVLVLNGRQAAIRLGNSVPLRLVQTVVQGGVLRVISGSVLVDANSGFSARPVWRGGNSAELELAAGQSARGGPGAYPPGAISSSSTDTVLSLPLGEWVTVAQSDDALSGSSSQLGGSAQSNSREALRVEVRLSVR